MEGKVDAKTDLRIECSVVRASCVQPCRDGRGQRGGEEVCALGPAVPVQHAELLDPESGSEPSNLEFSVINTL